MNKTKKSLLLFSAIMALGLVGCGNPSSNPSDGSDTVLPSETPSETPSESDSSETNTSETTPEEVVVKTLSIQGPTKTTYNVGDKLDTTGLVVTLITTTNGVADEGVVLDATAYKLLIDETEVSTDYVLATSGKVTVSVVLVEDSSITTSFELTVKDVITKSLSLTGPTKTTYTVGESLDTTGLVVTLTTVTNGSSQDSVLTSADYTLSISGIEIENGYTFEDAGTMSITVALKDDAKVNTKFSVTIEEAIPTVEYVGTYQLYNLDNGSTEDTLTLNEDGTILLQSSSMYFSGTYTEEDGRFSINGYKTAKLIYQKGFVSFAISNGYVGDSETYYYFGAKEVTTVNKIIKGNNERILSYTYKDTLGYAVVSNYINSFAVTSNTDITFTFDTGDFNTATFVDIADPVQEKEVSPLESFGFSTFKEEKDGQIIQHLYFSIDPETNKLDRLEKGQEAGTYTGEKGELVLDGFGKYTLGEETGTYDYDTFNNRVTITPSAGEEYLIILNPESKTYTIPVIHEDPFVESKTYTSEGNFTITFNNGKATIDGLNVYLIDDTVSYTFDSVEYTVSCTFEEDSWYGWGATYKFNFSISEDAKTITLLKDISDLDFVAGLTATLVE